jgi:hypothetical protein
MIPCRADELSKAQQLFALVNCEDTV